MLELRINGKTADIKEESIIAVTKQYESVHNPLNYYADWSKTVKLPISANNNAIFSNFNRLDSTVTNLSIDPVKKIPCMILNNNEPVLEGYCKLENANTIYTDEAYEITIYSTFGLVMNELKLLTFNKNAVDVDPRYIIDSPLSDDLVIDRNLVKQSFEQLNHSLTSNNVIDWIGFIPTYQGKYSDFSSDKEQLLPSGRTDDMSRERDEHYKREFRSYYQQPFIWVDKLWKVAKDKINSITDYTLNLDGSWFTGSNPYYKDLIYTCPSLFNSDDNFKQSTESYADTRNVVMFNKPSKNPSLSTHAYYQLYNLVSTNNTNIYDPNTGIFNTNADLGSTKLKGRFRLTLFASIPGYANDGYWYCKITDANPFYVKIKAVNTNTGQDIYGAKKTFLLYSDDYDVNSNSFDEGIDLGVCSIANTGVSLGFDGTSGYYPMINHTGYQTGINHAWDCDLNFELNVAENVPYKVYFEIWNANNGDPFEYTSTFSGIYWDWLWGDDFNTSYGQYNDKGYSMYFDTKNLSCESTENLRSGSNVSLYRIFPKDVTLCDVLLNYSKMFGLVWDVNEFEKTITVMTRNRFFEDYRILDWTDKVDRSKEFKFVPLNFDKKYVEFNFEEGDCHRLKNYESTYQISYGSKKLDTGYEFNSETNEFMENLTPSVVSQKRQYSCMMNTEYEDRPNFMGYSYMVYPNEHYVDNDDEGKNAGMSGAFYFRNGTFTPDSRLSHWDNNGNYVVMITDDTQHMIQTQEFCWNISGEGIVLCYALPDVSTISKSYNGKRYSVHFESPKEYYFETPDGETNYIYHSFWENYINERYCSQNKKLTAYVYLSIDEFKDIDFREFIKIDNILYHIDKIYDFNYNSDNPVKMDLVQVWDLSAYTNGQDKVPYLFTVPASVEVTTTNQTVPVYTSYNGWHIARQPVWTTASIDGNGDLTIRANSVTSEYRVGYVILLPGSTASPSDYYQLWYGWFLDVSQYPTNPYRLDVDRNTVVFDSLGGTQTVIVDCHDTSNDAITVTDNRSWITASIREYTQTFATRRRDCLHLDITVSPRTATISRNGTVTLSITANGTTYTQTINVGQQGGLRHTRDDNYRIITDIDSELVVRDANDNQVTTLISGNIYHFDDLFPEEIDIDSIRITGGGSVNITGDSGLQTITFMPQLSDGDEVGGGLITATTLNGNVVSYAYDVQVDGFEPTPETRHVIVTSDANTMFKIEASPSVMNPKTVNYYEDTFVDGTVITLTALPNAGYTLKRWIDQDGNIYTTPVVSFTVNSSLVDANNTYTINLESKETQRTYNVEFNAGDNGYITVGSDQTHYSTYTKTVLEGTTISDVRVTPNSGYTFAQWDDGSVVNPRDFTVYSNIKVKAIYNGGSYSNIKIDGGGLIGSDDYILLSLDGNDVAKVGVGEVKTVTVANGTYSAKLYCHINDIRSAFVEWNLNGTTERSNPFVNERAAITQDGYIKVVCAVGRTYNVTVKGDSNGSVSVNGGVGDFSQNVLEGSTLTLQAIPNQGCKFGRWSDGNTSNPRTLLVTRNVSLKASFIPTTYNVSISAGSNGSVSVNGVSGDYSQSVAYGTTLTLAATPNTGYFFEEWSDGNNNNPRSLTVTGDTTLNTEFVNEMMKSYFYVEDVSGSGSTLYIKGNNDAPHITVYKSTDQENWEKMGNTQSTPITATVAPNGKLYLKATTNSWYSNESNFNNIYYDGSFNIGGNIMSLLYGDNFYGQTTLSYNNTFRKLFYLRTVLDATKLMLPATTLSENCYRDMFARSSLVRPPQLPATKLAPYCYSGMFQMTGLSTAPVLPATTLADSCYFGMFFRTSLRTAPALPATTLTRCCYQEMFRECSNLTTAPTELPATTLAIGCYYAMFEGCSNLTTAPRILPATTLAKQCYNYMFRYCYTLTTAPELPAKTLVEKCYQGMFNNGSLAAPAALNKVIIYADDISATDCLSSWLGNAAANGDFYNLGGATYTSGASGIPNGWTVHTSL